MSEKKEVSNYYKENIPDLISDLKTAIKNNRKVITQDVKEGELSEDKFVNVLKARRMAADDTIFFLKQVDALENELNEVEAEDKKSNRGVSPTKQFSKKN